MSLCSGLSFWERVGLEETDRETCIRAVQDRYSNHHIEEFGQQGFCSFTLLAVPKKGASASSNGKSRRAGVVEKTKSDDEAIVQLRPSQHALDINIAYTAQAVYSPLAPSIQYLDIPLPGKLCAYEMGRLRGTPFSHLQPHSRALGAELRRKQERLMRSFADIIAHSWWNAQSASRPHRADSPMQPESDWLSQCAGKVGSSIEHRLKKLARELPDLWLRRQARKMLDALRRMDDIPVVLNHGDLIPSNVLVNEDTWEITGLVDWAEAEYLPFGTCLYGLEHMLGYISPCSKSSTIRPDGLPSSKEAPSFTYYDNASELRRIFWARLLGTVPWLVDRKEDVQIIRNIGVLLWYGIAWDDGAINRVVNSEHVEELACLRAFLTAS